MNITEAIRNRRSIRKYKEGIAIPEQDIHAILEAAMMAPSARNTRPWEFIVIKDAGVKEKIISVHPYAKHLRDASLGIVVCGRPDLSGDDAEAFWPQDCGAAIENILLQALELGYGSCWCGIYPRQERTREVQSILGITSIPVALITIGVADEAPAARGYYDETRVKEI